MVTMGFTGIYTLWEFNVLKMAIEFVDLAGGDCLFVSLPEVTIFLWL